MTERDWQTDWELSQHATPGPFITESREALPYWLQQFQRLADLTLQLVKEAGCWAVFDCHYRCPVCGEPSDKPLLDEKEYRDLVLLGDCTPGKPCRWAALVLEAKQLIERSRNREEGVDLDA